jgi:hypothetical protein
MYLKIFKGRHSSLSYLVIQDITLNGVGNPYIKNEQHEIVEVSESELFDAIDKLFKEKQNAII